MKRTLLPLVSGLLALIFDVGFGIGGAHAKKKARAVAPAAASVAAAAAAPAVPSVDVPGERKLLLGADVDRAIGAARKLGTSRARAALDTLLDALALGLSPRVAAVAVEAAGAHAEPRALDVLLYYATHRQVDVRVRAVEALGQFDDKRARVAVDRAYADAQKVVRAAACRDAERRKEKLAGPKLMALLVKGDEATSPALAAIASPELARQLAELVGIAPDALLAETLGRILARKDLGKEQVYVQIVESLGKVPGDEAEVQLATYAGAQEKIPRLSKRRAQDLLEQRSQENKGTP
ncbi:MAG: hypothetical protein EXR73_12545 [Myxococcales bacterium]|nr:hypothetical protein [Myxococcales bacterium]